MEKAVMDSVRLIELVISISNLTVLPPSLAVISCKGNISTSIGLVFTIAGDCPSFWSVQWDEA